MPEPSLSAAFTTLKSDVGDWLGYGRDEDDWDGEQAEDVEHAIKGGMRKLYYCGYDWSFLRPVASLTLLQGHSTVECPDDFGQPSGRIVVSVSGATFSGELDFGPIGDVYSKFALAPDTTGAPICACVEPIKGTSLTDSQRWRVYVYPAADQDYTLQFPMTINPDYLSGAKPYAYGGPQHAETLLAACRATAELDFNNVAQGPQFVEFMRLLQASKDIDGRQKPTVLGYNRDMSTRRRGRYWDRRDLYGLTNVTFNGTSY